MSMRYQGQQELQHQEGFTLLEAVIAMGILATGVISILVLSTQSLTVSSSLSNQFVASNFAREGMEIVRMQRDSNWLAFDTDSTTSWNNGLADGSDYTAVVTTFDTAASTHFDFTADAYTDSCPGLASSTYDCTSVWYDNTTDQYFQTANVLFDPTSSDYVETNYKRLVTLNPLCRNTADDTDETISASGCTGAYEQVGIAATVTVQYPGRSGLSEYVLEEHMYDWRY